MDDGLDSPSKFLLVILIICIFTFGSFFTKVSFASSNSITQTSQADFKSGTPDTNTDLDSTLGSITLGKNQTETFSQAGTSNWLQGTRTQTNTASDTIKLTKNFFSYTDDGSPRSIVYHRTISMKEDTTDHILVVGTAAGATTLDTKGTVDITDDTTLCNYNTTNFPQFNNQQYFWNVEYDHVNKLLYLFQLADHGLEVVDTKGTATCSDDVWLGHYNGGTTPGLASNYVYNGFVDYTNDLLWIATDGGVNVIDRHGTNTLSDDTNFKYYLSAGTYAQWIYLDQPNHEFYVGSINGGYIVYDTKGTKDPSDDTTAGTVNSTTLTGFPSNNIQHISEDPSGRYVLISTEGGGVAIVDTKNTISTSDDSLAAVYNTTATPAIPIDLARGHDFYYDQPRNRLYVATQNALYIINTNGTFPDPSDDTLFKKIDTTSNPPVLGGDSADASKVLVDSAGMVHVAAGNGLNIFDPDDNTYSRTGSFISYPIFINQENSGLIKWDSVAPLNTSIQTQIRSGTTNILYEDNFDDNNPSEYAGDFYGWNGFDAAGSVTEANGILHLTNLSQLNCCGNDDYFYFWLDFGKPNGYFPVGSRITTRIRFNSSTRVKHPTYSSYVFTDDYWESGAFGDQNNVWYDVSFNADQFNHPFSKIGFDIESLAGTLQSTDSIDVDLVRIESPIVWGNWSNNFSDNTGSILPSGRDTQTYLQYKTILNSTDGINTPTISKVALTPGYLTNAVFTSSSIDSGKQNSDWQQLSATSTLPAGSQINYFTRTANNTSTWSAWSPVTNGVIASPNGQFVQYQAVITSTDTLTTPQIDSVSLNYIPAVVVTTTLAPVSYTATPTPTIEETISPSPIDTVSPTPTTQRNLLSILKVKVTDDQNKPIENAKVTLSTDSTSKLTDKNGIATFNNVPIGDITVTIEVNGQKIIRKVNVTSQTNEVNETVSSNNAQQSSIWNNWIIYLSSCLILLILLFIIARIRKKDENQG